MTACDQKTPASRPPAARGGDRTGAEMPGPRRHAAHWGVRLLAAVYRFPNSALQVAAAMAATVVVVVVVVVVEEAGFEPTNS